MEVDGTDERTSRVPHERRHARHGVIPILGVEVVGGKHLKGRRGVEERGLVGPGGEMVQIVLHEPAAELRPAFSGACSSSTRNMGMPSRL